MYEDKNLRKEVEDWVNGFKAIPTSQIADMFYDEHTGIWRRIMEITPIIVGTEAYSQENGCEGEVISIDGDKVRISTPDGNEVESSIDDLIVDFRYSSFLAWPTMWYFSDPSDVAWIANNLSTMAKCGFRIYYKYGTGYVFGIDGFGYDFYEAHWIPLYKERRSKMNENLMG